MPKPSDRDRIIRLLDQSEGLSNLRVKAELNLNDDRYASVRTGLLDDGLVEKYVCRGGGIRLTRKGEARVNGYEPYNSHVDHEADLYEPLIDFLQKQAKEDEIPHPDLRVPAERTRAWVEGGSQSNASQVWPSLPLLMFSHMPIWFSI